MSKEATPVPETRLPHPYLPDGYPAFTNGRPTQLIYRRFNIFNNIQIPRGQHSSKVETTETFLEDIVAHNVRVVRVHYIVTNYRSDIPLSHRLTCETIQSLLTDHILDYLLCLDRDHYFNSLEDQGWNSRISRELSRLFWGNSRVAKSLYIPL